MISVEEFRPLLAARAQDFLKLANGLFEASPEQWNQRQLYHLYQSTTDLESYLDNYGARENRTYLPIRELIAIARWLSVGMSSLVHLDSRLPSYSFPDPAWVGERLAPTVRTSALRLGEMILRSLEALRETWTETGLSWPDGVMRVDSLAAAGETVRLPRDAVDQVGNEESRALVSRAALVASRFLRLQKHMARSNPRRINGLERLEEVVQVHCSEAQSRRFEARLHNLQSTYDSLVAGSPEEEKHPVLPRIRSAASTAFHLFEATTALVHLDERHRLDRFRGADGEALLDREAFLSIAINDCSVMAYECMTSVAPEAEAFLAQVSERCSRVFRVPDGVSLHARPISLIVSVVNHYRSAVEAEIDGDRCSAASIMQLLVLVGGHSSTREIRFYGDQRVLDDLQVLFEARLGEDGLDGLPESLSYLVQR
ncbi:MAG: HPr family phosphocarrier protein [Planctomycetota bacterium]|nr:MAG: HPr family phosphocarrier protein [Planctomycetota bacterium]